MGHRLTGNFDQDQVDGFESMQEDGKADNYSEAVRIASTVGLQELGYLNGENKNTLLKQSVYRFSWLFSIAGMVGLGFTFAYPVPARLPSFAVLVFGIALYGVSELLEDHEPSVTKKIKRLFGGETA